MREIVLVSRSESRGGRSAFDLVQSKLSNRGITIINRQLVRRRKHLKAVAAEAARGNVECLVVAGGDGAQSAAASQLKGTNTALAVIPAGTGNTLAYELDVLEMDKAIEAIVSGRVIEIDLGEVNGEVFINFSTVGVFAEAAKATPHWLKRIFGGAAYVLSGAPFLAQPPFRLHVEWDNCDLEILTHQAIVASGRYFGYTPVTSEAGMQTGKLAFFGVAGSSQTEILKTTAALLRGEQEELPGAHCFAAKKIKITCKPQQRLNIDGHDIGKTPAKFRILPRALRVVVPADYRRER